MDLSRLRRGEAIAALSGAALIVVMFLPWWSTPDTLQGIPLADIPGLDETRNAWQAASFNDVIWFVTGLAAVMLGVLAATQTRPDLPITASAILTVLGLIALVLIVVRLIDPPEALSREYGAWLGLLAILGIVYGTWTAMQQEDDGTARRRPRTSRPSSADSPG